jgi:outer membrane protein
MRSCLTRWAVGCAALIAATSAAQAQTPPVTPPLPAPPSGSPTPPLAPAPVPAPAPPVTSVPTVPPQTAPPGDSPQARVFGRVLSVDDAVAIALETQPSIQTRLSEYGAAVFRVDQEFSRLLPQLSAGWTAARSQNVGGISNAVTGTSERTWNTSSAGPRISLSQVLFDFGKTWASTDVARRVADSALEDTELQRQLVTQTVKESFTNINFAQRLIRVNEQALQRSELNLRSARGFFEVGTRPKSDVTRAEVDVANARLDVIRARNAERLARVALATAMGLPATTPLQIEDNLIYQPVSLDPARLLEEALRQRPESRRARLQADAAESRVRRAYRDFFPDITGNGFYGAQRTDFSEVWELGLSLTWTIFDGGNLIARYRETKALLDAERARVRATELDVSREVEQAQNNVIESQERIQAAQVAVASAQENFRLAQGRFDAGVGTILELTDAQLFLTLAQNTEAQALADYRIALARLDRATGRR